MLRTGAKETAVTLPPGWAVEIPASGSRPPPAPPTEQELREIFGGFLDTVRSRIHVHRAASDPLIDLGRTGRGTPVKINALLDWPAAVVVRGEIHAFHAGPLHGVVEDGASLFCWNP